MIISRNNLPEVRHDVVCVNAAKNHFFSCEMLKPVEAMTNMACDHPYLSFSVSCSLHFKPGQNSFILGGTPRPMTAEFFPFQRSFFHAAENQLDSLLYNCMLLSAAKSIIASPLNAAPWILELSGLEEIANEVQVDAAKLATAKGKVSAFAIRIFNLKQADKKRGKNPLKKPEVLKWENEDQDDLCPINGTETKKPKVLKRKNEDQDDLCPIDGTKTKKPKVLKQENGGSG